MKPVALSREAVAAKLAELVALVDRVPGGKHSFALGFLLGELQGLEITIRHGGCGIDGVAERFAKLVEGAKP